MCKSVIQTDYKVMGEGLPVFVLLTGVVHKATKREITITLSETGKQVTFESHQVHRFNDEFLPQLKTAKEYINTTEDSEDAWLCLCGNCEPMGYFFPCNGHGDEIEPTEEAGFAYLMGCDGCGRIIDSHDLSVVGQNTNPKRFD